MRSSAAIGIVIALLSTLALSGQAPRMTLGQVLLLTPSATPEGGSTLEYLFLADRGSRKGQHLHVWTRAAPPPRPSARGRSSEYHLVSPSTAGPLPDVDVLGIHYIKVRADRREAFEKF